MKNIFVLMVGLALAGAQSHASAHETAPGGDVPVNGTALDAHATAAGNAVEGSVVVRGTVAALKGKLYQLERWPGLFSDTSAMKRNADGTWSVDFRRFGHPHDFRIARTGSGVVFDLATQGHGAARLEYALEPMDANRSKLTVRLLLPTPPQLTAAQTIAMLRTKAQADLQDFETHANANVEGR